MRSKTNIRIQDAPHILITQKITRILGSLCPGPGAEASIFVFYAFIGIEITEKFWVVVGSFSCHTVACSFLGLTAWPPREIISPCSERLPYSMSGRETISIPSGGADSASAQRENPFLAIIFFFKLCNDLQKTKQEQLLKKMFITKREVASVTSVKVSHSWFTSVFCRLCIGDPTRILRCSGRSFRNWDQM